MSDKHPSDHTDTDAPIQLEQDERAAIERQLALHQQRLRDLPTDATAEARADVMLDVAQALVGLHRGDEAWGMAREALDAFLAAGQWENAVHACDVLYQAEQSASIAALGQGVWLAVTFPIDPQVTIGMLNNLIDEMPPKADGAAIAAITAHYVADLRTQGERHESLTFLTHALLGRVAERHSNVKNQDEMNAWLQRLNLLDPAVFLPRLSLVLRATVGENWWFDRDALREKLPAD